MVRYNPPYPAMCGTPFMECPSLRTATESSMQSFHSIKGLEHWLRSTLQDIADEAALSTFNLMDIVTGDLNFDCNGRSISVVIYVKVSKSEAHKVNFVLKDFELKVTHSIMNKPCFVNFIDLQFKVELTEPVSMIYCELKTAGKIKEENIMKQLPEIKKIIHSGDYTHIMWADGTKTSVKKAEDMPYDAYSAFAQAVVKKLFGSTEKAKFEHELRQHSEKEQKKILAEKESRRAKQQKAEKKKIDRDLKRQEKELAEKEEQVKATRAKRQSMFKRSGESM